MKRRPTIAISAELQVGERSCFQSIADPVPCYGPNGELVATLTTGIMVERAPDMPLDCVVIAQFNIFSSGAH